MIDYLEDLEKCELCEWRCKVNRLEGERGVCDLGKPVVSSRMLHPASPKSYTIFMNGCNFRCLNCQNWEIAHKSRTEDSKQSIDPKKLGEEAYRAVNSARGKRIGADRIFFSGGSPTVSLPYVEKVVEEARNLGEIKVNYDTNGFLTKDSLKRVIDFADSITFDIKSYHDEVHRALTGAPVEPVLRNVKYLIKNAKDKIWEFRTLVIPEITEEEVKYIASFLADIDLEVDLNLLAFRPNFVLENYQGATRKIMETAVESAKEAGLKNVSWSGRTGINGHISDKRSQKYERKEAQIAGGIAESTDCVTHPRDCSSCLQNPECPIKNYEADRRT